MAEQIAARIPIGLNLRALSLLEGLRAGVAIAVTMAAGSIFGLPQLGLAALGALLTCFADPGGPILRRLPALLAFGFIGALVFGGFGLIRSFGPLIVVPLAVLAIFVTSFARIYGQGGLQVGNLLSVVVVLALDTPLHTFGQAAALGVPFLAGSLWATLLALAVWRIRPYGPARQALANVSRALAELALDLARLAMAAESEESYSAHARDHRRAVREAIETARGIALDTFRRRGAASQRAAQLAVRLESFEQVFSLMIGLSEALEQDEVMRSAVEPSLRLLAGWLAAIGPEIQADRSLDTPRKRLSLQHFRDEVAKIDAASTARHLLDRAAERLAVLITVSAPAGQRAGFAPAELPGLGARILAPIQANAGWQSAALRHAARAAAVSAPAFIYAMFSHNPYQHWMTITLILTLQPYFSATWVRALERIGGTVLGAFIAAGIGYFCTTKLSLAVTMIPLTVFAFTIRGISYGAFIAALTPMIVLLIEQFYPGSNDLLIASNRVAFTLVGGLMAVAGNLLLWPGFEHNRLDAARAAAMAAHAAYIDAAFAALLNNGGIPEPQRRAAGLASNNFEAGLSRALLEPHRGRDATLERCMVTDAALRRMAGRLAVLLLDRPTIAPDDHPAWLAWRDWLIQALTDPAGLAPRPALPAGQGVEPGHDALTRLARQAELTIGGSS